VIDPATRAGAVHLTIGDLNRWIRFYGEAAGIRAEPVEGGILIRDPALNSIRLTQSG
jgi:hypothetical protein